VSLRAQSFDINSIRIPQMKHSRHSLSGFMCFHHLCSFHIFHSENMVQALNCAISGTHMCLSISLFEHACGENNTPPNAGLQCSYYFSIHRQHTPYTPCLHHGSGGVSEHGTCTLNGHSKSVSRIHIHIH
jgi:hypothetical protein